jgi:hypothetical protein
MYVIKKTGETFASFIEACHAGQNARSEVFQVDTGVRRWAPAEPIAEKKKRMYEQRLAAYESQMKMRSAKKVQTA